VAAIRAETQARSFIGRAANVRRSQSRNLNTQKAGEGSTQIEEVSTIEGMMEMLK
jgi:hypothetical protein